MARRERETERRWIIELLPGGLDGLGKVEIEQGYLITDMLTERNIRVRIEDNVRAEIITKHGHGVDREEEFPPDPTSVAQARWFLDQTAYKVTKDRYLLPATDGLPKPWEIDTPKAPFGNLKILERELPSRDSPIVFPEGRFRVVKEVTNSLTNFQLALMAPELADDEAASLEYINPEHRLPIWTLSGGPTCGKSTLLRELDKELTGIAHCVPETASILIKQVKVLPYKVKPEGSANAKAMHFQRLTYRVQRTIEKGADFEARMNGCKVILTDRGGPDGVAYTPKGRPAFERHILGKSLTDEHKRYQLVIILGMPPRHIYEEIKAKSHELGEARYENSYEEACATHERTENESWSDHANRHVIPHVGGYEGYALKGRQVRAIIAEEQKKLNLRVAA